MSTPKKVDIVSNEAIIPTLPELSAKEREDIYAAARKKVLEELKQQKADELQAQYEVEVRQGLVPDEAMEPIMIDVAGSAYKITLDGVEYFHGRTYHLPLVKRAALLEIMYRTYAHEDAVRGDDENKYRKERMANVSGKFGVTSQAGIMRM
jgi:hypothetical protein